MLLGAVRAQSRFGRRRRGSRSFRLSFLLPCLRPLAERFHQDHSEVQSDGALDDDLGLLFVEQLPKFIEFSLIAAECSRRLDFREVFDVRISRNPVNVLFQFIDIQLQDVDLVLDPDDIESVHQRLTECDRFRERVTRRLTRSAVRYGDRDKVVISRPHNSLFRHKAEV